MLQNGIIRRSTSEYASPIVMVTKKDDRQRLCVDYRRLNAKTLVETSQLPPIVDLLPEIGEAKVLTTLDLKSGYWQVPVAEECRHLTAFTTPDGGSYEYNVMPFGLALGTFQKLMVNVLAGYLHEFAKVYLDDVIVYSANHEEHRHHLDLVLERLEMHGLVCAPEKCRLATSRIEYLGHTITADDNLPQEQQYRSSQPPGV